MSRRRSVAAASAQCGGAAVNPHKHPTAATTADTLEGEKYSRCMTPCGQGWSVLASTVLVAAIVGPALWLHPLVGLVVYVFYYTAFAVEKPKITYQRNERNERILARCHTLRTRYWPAPFVLQSDMSIIFYLLKERISCCNRAPCYEREELELEDGGLIAIDWLNRPGSTTTHAVDPMTPVVLVLPGVTASSNDLSTASLAAAAASRGWRAAVFIRRGLGGLELKTPRFNIFGDTCDTDVVVRHIAAACPEAPVAVIGFSAGSALAVRYVGELATPEPHPPGWVRHGSCHGEKTDTLAASTNSPVVCAAAISGGFCLGECMHAPSAMWRMLMAVRIGRYFLLANDHFPMLEKAHRTVVDAVRKALARGSVHDTVSAMAPFAGCANFDDYLERSNPMVPITPLPPKGMVPLLVMCVHRRITRMAKHTALMLMLASTIFAEG